MELLNQPGAIRRQDILGDLACPQVSFDLKLGATFDHIDFDQEQYVQTITEDFGERNMTNAETSRINLIFKPAKGPIGRIAAGVHDRTSHETTIWLTPKGSQGEVNDTLYHESYHASTDFKGLIDPKDKKKTIASNLAMASSLPLGGAGVITGFMSELITHSEAATQSGLGVFVGAVALFATGVSIYRKNPEEQDAKVMGERHGRLKTLTFSPKP